jgi:enediyne biosynthesis protein E4
MRFLVYAVFGVICLLAIGLSLLALRPVNWQNPSSARSVNPTQATTPIHIRFNDVAQRAGIDFCHRHRISDMHYVPEIMGSGVAWIDYDQDGYVDLFLVQAGNFPPDPDGNITEPTSRLYRNQGDGTFVDVTSQVGLLVTGFGQGVAVGDYDNDGFPDLFVTCYGRCHLYHNEPDGRGSRRFREVTREAGVEIDGWCTSCAFADLHGNGFLDLFVCRYVQMDLYHYPFCGYKDRDPPVRISCPPREFPGGSSILFRNDGNGKFTNVSREAGLEPDGKGLGVVILDFDGDGKADIFVGNDEVPNFHYRNLGGGRFQSCGILSGAALTGQGTPMGSMGVDAEDTTGSGRPDLFVTTYYHEGTTLYRNEGNNVFADASAQTGMLGPSWDKVGWGTGFLDLDRDGSPDLFVANGHVYRNAAELPQIGDDGRPLSYQQFPQLFLNNGRGVFREISKEAGPYFEVGHVGRGVAIGDYDNDGAMDIAINHCGEPATLLHNETETPHHWIRLVLEGSRHVNPHGSNRDAIGACVKVRVGDRTLVRHIKGGGSYFSASDRRLLVGLGSADRVDSIEVRWPNTVASVEHFGALSAGHTYKLAEGTGQAVEVVCPPIRVR